MKINLLILFIAFSTISIGQADLSEEKILESLAQKIKKSERNEKLKWLDSMANYVAFNTRFESDTVVRQTVKLALELDSIGMAIRQTGNLIHYQNNIVGKPEVGIALFNELKDVAETATAHRARYKFYLEGADSYYFIDDHEKAITYYNIAEEAARKGGHEKGIGIAKLYKGGSYSLMGKFAEASQILQEAAVVFKKTKDTFNIIGAKNSLSILYSQNAFFDEAEAERNEAIELAKKINSQEHLVSFYFNAATDAGKLEDHSSAVNYLMLAIAANENTRTKNTYQPILYSNLIVAHTRQDSVVQAEQYLEELEALPEAQLDENNRALYVNALKHIAFKRGEYNKAVLYGREHLESKLGGSHYEEIEFAERFLAEAFEKAGNSEAALLHFKNSERIRDSILNVQKTKALTYYQTLYETEKRDATIEAQKKDIALLDAKNKIQNQWMLVGALLLLSIFGIIVLIRSRNAAKRRQVMQEDFSQNLILAQEEERTRVARELHDSVGQKLMLLTKQTKISGDPSMEALAGTTLDELRSISRNLHPATLEKLGISVAIESLVNEVDAYSPIFFTNEIENVDSLLSKDHALHLYRIIQEVLSNMVKHSEAKAASVVIQKQNNGIQAVIKDNGRGFDFAEKIDKTQSLGMKTLRERAKIIKSKLIVASIKNKGTTVTLKIPILRYD